ncbi:uncharacterized protein LOC117812951 isoform X1 [Xyrichtys novacula]|uniref:Uncharacterized protein LOC117812951 isoform X1 n=1 Tax=Xyrichtys novacula TaxID=13765 RepID=A0AAV1FWD0_XYRNO|nr:uncharacterized protein LOC117812951 isoform X1 [Xyrichtys novacula]
MENREAPQQLLDHDYAKERRASACQTGRKRRASRCFCCRNDQDSQHHHSAPSGSQPKKRKRTSAVRSSDSAGLTQDPAPQPSHAHDAGDPPLVPRPQPTVEPFELPQVLPVVHHFQPPTSPPLHDDPLIIHHQSVEEYQQLYHSVADDMLWYKNGLQRPYSLTLGRLIKQKLWEQLDRPQFTETVDDNGLVCVNTSYGVGVYPPLYDVDTSGEPKPKTSPRKRPPPSASASSSSCLKPLNKNICLCLYMKMVASTRSLHHQPPPPPVQSNLEPHPGVHQELDTSRLSLQQHGKETTKPTVYEEWAATNSLIETWKLQSCEAVPFSLDPCWYCAANLSPGLYQEPADTSSSRWCLKFAAAASARDHGR